MTLPLAIDPFLPPGRGALILMLGGLVVLPVSLLLSRMGVRTPRAQALEFVTVKQRQQPHAAPRPAAARPVAEWQQVEWEPVPPASLPAAPQAAAPRHHVSLRVPEPRPWGGTGLERAIRQAVGATVLLHAEPGRYVVRLGRCDSCARHLHGCAREAEALRGAVGDYLRDAHVTEVACSRLDRRTTCTFDVRGR